ncbi:hypothetical protein BC831DRAFT_480289 [Entophlyctis helioformis]|nr:hypothetical protein BC831DRAFT_480289 [Entophlyctis helioformis]
MSSHSRPVADPHHTASLQSHAQAPDPRQYEGGRYGGSKAGRDSHSASHAAAHGQSQVAHQHPHPHLNHQQQQQQQRLQSGSHHQQHANQGRFYGQRPPQHSQQQQQQHNQQHNQQQHQYPYQPHSYDQRHQQPHQHQQSSQSRQNPQSYYSSQQQHSGSQGGSSRSRYADMHKAPQATVDALKAAAANPNRTPSANGSLLLSPDNIKAIDAIRESFANNFCTPYGILEYATAFGPPPNLNGPRVVPPEADERDMLAWTTPPLSVVMAENARLSGAGHGDATAHGTARNSRVQEQRQQHHTGNLRSKSQPVTASSSTLQRPKDRQMATATVANRSGASAANSAKPDSSIPRSLSASSARYSSAGQAGQPNLAIHAQRTGSSLGAASVAGATAAGSSGSGAMPPAATPQVSYRRSSFSKEPPASKSRPPLESTAGPQAPHRYTPKTVGRATLSDSERDTSTMPVGSAPPTALASPLKPEVGRQDEPGRADAGLLGTRDIATAAPIAVEPSKSVADAAPSTSGGGQSATAADSLAVATPRAQPTRFRLKFAPPPPPEQAVDGTASASAAILAAQAQAAPGPMQAIKDGVFKVPLPRNPSRSLSGSSVSEADASSGSKHVPLDAAGVSSRRPASGLPKSGNPRDASNAGPSGSTSSLASKPPPAPPSKPRTKPKSKMDGHATAGFEPLDKPAANKAPMLPSSPRDKKSDVSKVKPKTAGGTASSVVGMSVKAERHAPSLSSPRLLDNWIIALTRVSELVPPAPIAISNGRQQEETRGSTGKALDQISSSAKPLDHGKSDSLVGKSSGRILPDGMRSKTESSPRQMTSASAKQGPSRTSSQRTKPMTLASSEADRLQIVSMDVDNVLQPGALPKKQASSQVRQAPPIESVAQNASAPPKSRSSEAARVKIGTTPTESQSRSHAPSDGSTTKKRRAIKSPEPSPPTSPKATSSYRKKSRTQPDDQSQPAPTALAASNSSKPTAGNTSTRDGGADKLSESDIPERLAPKRQRSSTSAAADLVANNQEDLSKAARETKRVKSDEKPKQAARDMNRATVGNSPDSTPHSSISAAGKPAAPIGSQSSDPRRKLNFKEYVKRQAGPSVESSVDSAARSAGTTLSSAATQISSDNAFGTFPSKAQLSTAASATPPRPAATVSAVTPGVSHAAATASGTVGVPSVYQHPLVLTPAGAPSTPATPAVLMAAAAESPALSLSSSSSDLRSSNVPRSLPRMPIPPPPPPHPNESSPSRWNRLMSTHKRNGDYYMNHRRSASDAEDPIRCAFHYIFTVICLMARTGCTEVGTHLLACTCQVSISRLMAIGMPSFQCLAVQGCSYSSRGHGRLCQEHWLAGPCLDPLLGAYQETCRLGYPAEPRVRTPAIVGSIDLDARLP